MGTNALDIQFNLSPDYSDDFIAPQYGGGRFYGGTTISATTLPQVRLAAVGITMNEWRAITSWFAPSAVGRLRFAFNHKTFYWVKVGKSPMGNVTWINSGKDSLNRDIFTVQFSLSFTTVSDYAALGEVNITSIGEEILGGWPILDTSNKIIFDTMDVMLMDTNENTNLSPTMGMCANNSYYFPLLYPLVEENGYIGTYYIYNTGAYDAYPNFYLTGLQSDFQIAVNYEKIYEYSFNFPPRVLSDLEIFGDRGLVLYNGRIVEDARANGLKVLDTAYNRGRCPIATGNPEMFIGKVVSKSLTEIVVAIDLPKYNRYGMGYSVSMFSDVQELKFNDDVYPINCTETDEATKYPILLHDHVFVADGGEDTSKITTTTDGCTTITLKNWIGH